jgi:hypothetical protein
MGGGHVGGLIVGAALQTCPRNAAELPSLG